MQVREQVIVIVIGMIAVATGSAVAFDAGEALGWISKVEEKSWALFVSIVAAGGAFLAVGRKLRPRRSAAALATALALFVAARVLDLSEEVAALDAWAVIGDGAANTFAQKASRLAACVFVVLSLYWMSEADQRPRKSQDAPVRDRASDSSYATVALAAVAVTSVWGITSTLLDSAGGANLISQQVEDVLDLLVAASLLAAGLVYVQRRTSLSAVSRYWWAPPLLILANRVLNATEEFAALNGAPVIGERGAGHDLTMGACALAGACSFLAILYLLGREIERSRKKLKKTSSELIAVQHQLGRIQGFDNLGVFTAGIAHDFNNVLTSVVLAAEHSLSGVPRDSAVRANLEAILTAGKRSQALTQQLLKSGRASQGREGPVDLAAVLNDFVRLLQASRLSAVDVEVQIGAEPALVRASEAEIVQLALNLIGNACDAVEEGGVVRIGLNEVSYAADAAVGAYVLSPGPYLLLTVLDTGRGIPSGALGRIFEPVFTTKEDGAGLGLWRAAEIVRALGGAIEAHSVEGVGTRFEVHLPAEGSTGNDTEAMAARAAGEG